MIRKKQPIPNEESPRRRNAEPDMKKRTTSFSRGQTISGYRKEESERAQTRKLIIRRRKLSSVFMVLIAASLVILFIFFQIVVKVDFTTSESAQVKNSEEYASIVDKYYQDHPVERLRLFLNKDRLLAALQSQNPEVELVGDLSFNQTLSLQ